MSLNPFLLVLTKKSAYLLEKLDLEFSNSVCAVCSGYNSSEGWSEQCEHFVPSRLQVIPPNDSVTITKPVRFMMERVKSKQLFNFRPAGVIDGDILEQEKEMYETMGGADSGEMFAKLDAMPDEEFGVFMRGMMDGWLDTMFNNPLFTEVEYKYLENRMNINECSRLRTHATSQP